LGEGVSDRGLRPVARETLQSKVLAELRRAIMGGVFKPGETVTLRRLADDFGVSVMPVREAVNRLISERALELLPNRMVIVPEMTRRRFRDLTTVRLMVEREATRVAAQAMAPGTIRALEHENERIRERLTAGDWQGALLANREFHFLIYRSAGSAVFGHVIESLWLQVGPFLVFSMELPAARWTTEHHVQVMAALKARKVEAAVAAIGADIEETATRLLEVGVFGDDSTPL